MTGLSVYFRVYDNRHKSQISEHIEHTISVGVDKLCPYKRVKGNDTESPVYSITPCITNEISITYSAFEATEN